MLGEAQRHLNYKAIGYVEHVFEDGSVIVQDSNQGSVLRLEQVIAEEGN